MNTIDAMEFAQLLASRICHDLISPVAAVNNGIELLLEENDDDIESRNRALELIEDSAKVAAIKLKLMRAAFGAGQTLQDNCSKNELLALCQPIAVKNKVDILWDDSDNQHFSRTQSRLILNLFMILLEALPRGGMIELSTQETPQELLRCVVDSQKLMFSDDKIAYLSGKQAIPHEPRYIGFTILHLLAEGKIYDVEKNENQLTIKLSA